jgi:hypothetical protein
MTRLSSRLATLPLSVPFVVLLALAGALFLVIYLGHLYLPGNIPQHPDGWFASFDQGLYRKAAVAFAHLNLSNQNHFYPPLFSLLGAPFVLWWPNHAFLVPSLICLGVHLYGLVVIGERYFGRWLTYAVIAVLFVAFPKTTIEQWVIPWTSSATGALASILFVLLYRLATKANPWAIETRADHATLYGFYLAYGAVFAARPLDVVILFPVAAVVALAVLWKLGPTAKLLRICMGIGFSGSLVPALYLALNYHNFGDPFGGYFRLGQMVGFILGPQVLERAVSLWIDSNGIYPEQGQPLSTYFPLLIPALVLCVTAVVSGPIVIRMIALTSVLLIASHVAFSELSPENLFASNLTHYFKWGVPWLLLIATGQFVHYLKTRAWLPLGAALVFSVLAMSIRLDVVPLAGREARDEARGSITITLPEPRHIDVLDAIGF